MKNPGMLEIICARQERRMMDRIGEAIHRYCEARPFPRMTVSGDIRGNVNSSTIAGHSLAWIIAGCTALGNPIHIEVEIIHDETWIPVIAISSTELEEPMLIVAERHDDDTFAAVMDTLDELVATASARSKFERANMGTLLAGQTNLTIYE
jgi:hypothetical protein